jgi:hypothetical protein
MIGDAGGPPPRCGAAGTAAGAGEWVGGCAPKTWLLISVAITVDFGDHLPHALGLLEKGHGRTGTGHIEHGRVDADALAQNGELPWMA